MTTRVLHLIKGLGPGGAEQLLVNQAQAAHDEDLDFHVAYLVSWKDHRVAPLAAAGWTVHCLRSDRPWDLRWVVRLRRLLVGKRFGVVHGHSPLVSAFARATLRSISKSRRPFSIYTEHNDWRRHRPWTRRLNRWTIKNEDQIIAVSQGVKDSMPDDLDVQVLLHGIDVDAVSAQAAHRAAARTELGIAPDEVVIGIVANFRREKAYDVLLAAAATVIERRPHVRFVSVGQGPLESEIRKQHERLGLGDRFLLLGYREDATRIMSAFDVFTLTSNHEGLPVSVMEAMALRLPIVATAVGGIPEAVEGYSAILVEESNPDLLAQAYLTMESSRAEYVVSPNQTSCFDSAVAAQTLDRLYLQHN